MIVPDAVFGAAVIAGSSSVPPQLLTLTYSLSEIDRKQNTITVGSCRYSHFASYIYSMYIGSVCKLVRMTVGFGMYSNFGSFIYISLPIPRPIPLPPPLPLSLDPSPSPLFCLSLFLYVEPYINSTRSTRATYMLT